MTIAIPALPADFLDRVRSDGFDALGQPVRRLRAEGGEPCRDALRRARPGEDLILASFTPFSRSGPYKEYGPVFLFAEPQDEPVPRNVLPTAGAEPYLREQFVIRAYSKDEEIRDARFATPATAEETIARFFADEVTAFLHVRFPTYGCFACRIDRA
ncbi:MAG TPA: DUF1203 domain-containing protein [Thermoanaerobaculia bacterium]|nr:DUF1203 domain-containing protein [Thermoanaerobaculia bacterium]